MGQVSEGSKAARFGFIAENRVSFGVRYLCKRLGVHPAGFYKWQTREEAARTLENRRLAKLIKQLFVEHDGNYGSPRICAALRQRGQAVSHKRVERLMRDMGLVGKVSKLYRSKPLPENPCIRVGNRKRLEAAPVSVNQQWAGDVTYLKVNGQWSYLAVIIDLYSRSVVGWELSQSRTADLTVSALKKALMHRDVKPGMIFHSVSSEHFHIVADTYTSSEVEMQTLLETGEAVHAAIAAIYPPGRRLDPTIEVRLNGDARNTAPFVDGEGTIHLWRYSQEEGGYGALFAHEIVHAIAFDHWVESGAVEWPDLGFYNEGWAEYAALLVDSGKTGFPLYGFDEDVVAGHWVAHGGLTLAALRAAHLELNKRCEFQAYVMRASWFRYVDEMLGREVLQDLVAEGGADA